MGSWCVQRAHLDVVVKVVSQHVFDVFGIENADKAAQKRQKELERLEARVHCAAVQLYPRAKIQSTKVSHSERPEVGILL